MNHALHCAVKDSPWLVTALLLWMTLTCWASTAWFAKVRGEKRKPEINHSPEQLWPGQKPSSFCVCELEGKMERSNIFNVAMLTRDEMDGDSFYMSRGQFCDTAQEREPKRSLGKRSQGTHEFCWHSMLFHPEDFPRLSPISALPKLSENTIWLLAWPCLVIMFLLWSHESKGLLQVCLTKNRATGCPFYIQP